MKHVAIIMDGNGRWAVDRKRPRVWGHIRGARKVIPIVEEASDLGLKSLTLYTFSTENWSRPNSEIRILFKLLKKFLIRERKKIIENNVKFNVIGSVGSLEEETKNLIQDLELETKENSGLNLNFAFDYGGRKEILDSINSFIKTNPGKELNQKDLENNLYNPKLKDIDLMIRTGGDMRISNFLLWELAYAELYFTPIKWPEFSKEIFKHIITEMSGRERRFGGLEGLESISQVKKSNSKDNSYV